LLQVAAETGVAAELQKLEATTETTIPDPVSTDLLHHTERLVTPLSQIFEQEAQSETLQ
jgi:hypothetical protein